MSKKSAVFLATLCLSMSMLVACGDNKEEKNNEPDATVTTEVTKESTKEPTKEATNEATVVPTVTGEEIAGNGEEDNKPTEEGTTPTVTESVTPGESMTPSVTVSATPAVTNKATVAPTTKITPTVVAKPTATKAPTSTPKPTASPTPASKDIPIDEAHFPDEAFRKCISQEYDPNQDGKLSPEEIENTKEVYARSMYVNSIEGIQYFYNLETLHIQSSFITDLDLSKYTNFKTISFYNCYNEKVTLGNNVESLILSGSDNLESLDISGCTNLKWLYFDGGTKISKFDFSKNTNLVEIDMFSYRNIESLDVSMLPNLSCLSLRGCENITELNLRKNAKLKKLQCFECNISSLDLSNNKMLEMVIVDEKTTLTGVGAGVKVSHNSDDWYE